MTSTTNMTDKWVSFTGNDETKVFDGPFQPNLVWVKDRKNATNGTMVDVNQRAGRIFVVAGTHAEYKTYVYDKIKQKPELKSNDFCYVNRVQDLLGLDKVHGVFVGTYKSRIDIHDICTRIKLINRLPNIAELFPGEKKHYLDTHPGTRPYQQLQMEKQAAIQGHAIGHVYFDEMTSNAMVITDTGPKILGTPQSPEIFKPITDQDLWGPYDR